jgi:hypothetical protein
MPLNVPSLDDRNYADILQDALARIPVHNPEWTNFNDSDPGVTLLQLFAFMTESILYRANQIPERNRLKFLKLLGIPLRPATAATGLITLTNQRGPLESKPFPVGSEVRSGSVPFRTTQGLTVLPVEAYIVYKKPLSAEQEADRAELYSQLYADLLDQEASEPALYETIPMPLPAADGTLPILDLGNDQDTVDGCLWIALLARKGDVVRLADGKVDLTRVKGEIANQTLTIGIMPHLSLEGVVIPSGQTSRSEPPVPLRWEIAQADTEAARYRLLDSRSTGNILNAPGLVELTLPASASELKCWDWSTLEPGLEGTGDYPPKLADPNLRDRVVTWLRLRLDTPPTDQTVQTRLSWLGINATMVQQRVTVTGEILGTGTGEPDQNYRLANASVLPETLSLTVGEDQWHRIDDLLAAEPEVPVNSARLPLYPSEAALGAQADHRTQVFALDPESGEITFGDGTHGARPKLSQRIVASYAYGGGRQGNVGIGMLNRSPQLPAGYQVTNPLRTWGGEDAQTTASAEKTIPRTVQHRDRLVSEQDFQDIARQTPGVDIGRVEVLPLFVPGQKDLEIPGAVTVMVIPASSTDTAPQPDAYFLGAVCRHLQPRRLVTTELHIRGPEYVDIWVSVGIQVYDGYATGPVQAAVKQALLRFLSPLYGGYQGRGWPLKKSVRPEELSAVVTRVEGVQLVVNDLLLGTALTRGVSVVNLEGLQLPRLVKVAVTLGDPLPLDQLYEAPAPPDEERQHWMPIPVLPERC